jgi:polyisoprenoid-binding protein YceI
MVLRVLIASALMTLVANVSLAQNVKLDLEKSKIDFVGKKPAGESHKGGFKEYTADAKIDWETPANSKLVIEIKTASLWSDNDKLTAHLKNPDFFNADKFPKIKFESTEIKSGESEGSIKGKLTMLDKTEEVTVPVKVEVSDGNLIVKAEFKLDRTKWGMNFGRPNINDEVEITAVLHYIR